MSKKPRVVFAFTEAGLGHIMPLKSIVDTFEKKYGDKVEIVRSNFFTETNKAPLIKYEKFLINEVKKQNKYKLVSWTYDQSFKGNGKGNKKC